MILHHRKHLLMAAVGALLSAGAAAVATAYPDDGRVHIRHAITAQECAFDDQAQLDTFLANVEDASNWQLCSQADPAGAVDLEQLRAELQADNPPEAPAPAADQAAAAPAVTEAPAAPVEAPAAAAPKTRKTAAKA